MKANDPGPIKDEKVKAELKEKYGKRSTTALTNLKKCLAIDKENEDAMSYLNLLLAQEGGS